MERRTQLAIGGVLVAGGLGAGAYILQQYLHGRVGAAYVRSIDASTDPPEPVQAGVREMALTVSWENPTASTVTYGIQGATVQDGLVTGHWWASLDLARQAVQRYQSGDQAGARQMAVNPLYRVPYVQIGGGQRGQIKIYESVDIQPGEEWWLWVVPTPGGKLLANDPQDQHVTSLPTPQLVVKVQVK